MDHKKNLLEISNQQKIILTEIQDLNNSINIKKEQYLKLQGIIEYLTANGISSEEDQEN